MNLCKFIFTYNQNRLHFLQYPLVFSRHFLNDSFYRGFQFVYQLSFFPWNIWIWFLSNYYFLPSWMMRGYPKEKNVCDVYWDDISFLFHVFERVKMVKDCSSYCFLSLVHLFRYLKKSKNIIKNSLHIYSRKKVKEQITNNFYQKVPYEMLTWHYIGRPWYYRHLWSISLYRKLNPTIRNQSLTYLWI